MWLLQIYISQEKRGISFEMTKMCQVRNFRSGLLLYVDYGCVWAHLYFRL
jgi:hypothetical protein